uniref:E3 ubiquitin/ISG15 ligase TRIM25-like n=2 Tax=Iconisemion striatum TaxID=60296 RepID=A0A1A7X4N7_9TELE
MTLDEEESRMEETEQSRLEELLTCPVCQDIFKDPQQLPCGHSLCGNCLKSLVDHSSHSYIRCPDCRADFIQMFEAQKSYALANIAEDFRLTKKRRDKEAKCVYCDCCPERKTLAFKTCLKCEVSLCQEHIRDHLELPVFTGHPLVTPLNDLQERRCPQHKDAVLRYYCSSSRRYICNICALEGKQMNAASDTSNVLRRQLTEHMDLHFKMLREQIIESTNDQRGRPRSSPADVNLNGVTVVLLFLWLIVLYYAYNYSVENQTLTEALEKQQSRVHHIYSTIADHLVEKSHKTAKTEDKGVVRLNVNTASRLLGVSADLRTAERVKLALDYPISDERFDAAPQILSTPCFHSSIHMWEVEAEGCWDIAVSYTSIQRKGKDNSSFGQSAESWSLTHSGEGKLFAFHNKHKTTVSAELQSSRVMVVVNFIGGSITFRAADTNKTQLHKFKVDLTKPVCLGFGLHHVDPPSRASIVKAS